MRNYIYIHGCKSLRLRQKINIQQLITTEHINWRSTAGPYPKEQQKKSKLKKGQLETKKLLKITILNEEELSYNQQTELKQCRSEVEEICTIKPGNWPPQHPDLKINSGFHARENPPEVTISESELGS